MIMYLHKGDLKLFGVCKEITVENFTITKKVIRKINIRIMYIPEEEVQKKKIAPIQTNNPRELLPKSMNITGPSNSKN